MESSLRATPVARWDCRGRPSGVEMRLSPWAEVRNRVAERDSVPGGGRAGRASPGRPRSAAGEAGRVPGGGGAAWRLNPRLARRLLD